MKLNLGAGNFEKAGFVDVDINPVRPGSIVQDLNFGLPTVDDNTVTYIEAHHILEHITRLDFLMDEIARVCVPGARVDIVVPLANTLWDVADPSHVRKFNHKTFEYYCKGYHTSYERPRKFNMISMNIDRQPNEWFGGIEWIVANLHVVLEVSHG